MRMYAFEQMCLYIHMLYTHTHIYVGFLRYIVHIIQAALLVSRWSLVSNPGIVCWASDEHAALKLGRETDL